METREGPPPEWEELFELVEDHRFCEAHWVLVDNPNAQTCGLPGGCDVGPLYRLKEES